jgi:hypothetical protein
MAARPVGLLQRGGYLNSYYMATMSPAIAGLCGTGFALFCRHRRRPVAHATLAAALVTSVAYGIHLLSGGSRVPGWLVPAALCLGAAGALALLAPRRSEREGRRLGPTLALAAVGLLLIPTVTSILGVTWRLGPFAAHEPASAVLSHPRNRRACWTRKSWNRSPRATRPRSPSPPTPPHSPAHTSSTPAGDPADRRYQGGIPAPTLGQLRGYIASGQVRAFIVPIVSSDPRIAWIRTHCTRASQSTSGSRALTALYDCQEA